MARRVRSSVRGSTILMVLFGFTAMGIALMAMNQYLGIFGKIRKSSGNKMHARVVLSSVLAQMTHLLKLGVVIEKDTLSIAAPQPGDINAWATNTSNLGRLTIPDMQLPFINSALNAAGANPIKSSNDRGVVVNEMSWTSNLLEGMTQDNPLYWVLQHVQGIESVTFNLKRMDADPNFPHASATVFVKIEATVNGDSSKFEFFRNRILTGEAIIAISPRELNQFAFVGGIMDASTGLGATATQAGQLTFGSVANKTGWSTSGVGGGVHFFGKTIFNEIRFPAAPNISVADFGDEVTTYSPPKNSDGTYFRPATAGGQGSFLISDIPGIKFSRGIKLDIPDPGLPVLFQMETPSGAGSAGFCAEYAKSFLDLEETQPTCFGVVNYTDPSAPAASAGNIVSRFRLAWDGFNAIMEQNDDVRAIACTDVPGRNCSGVGPIQNYTWDADQVAVPALRIQIAMTNSSGTTHVEFKASRDDLVIFRLDQQSQAANDAARAEVARLTPLIAAAQGIITAAGDPATLQTRVNEDTTAVGVKQSAFDSAKTTWLGACNGNCSCLDSELNDQGKGGGNNLEDPNCVAYRTADVDLKTAQDKLNTDTSALTGYTTAKADFDRFTIDKAAAEATIAATDPILAHPPTLTIRTKPWVVGPTEVIQVNESKLDITTTDFQNSDLSLAITVASGEKGSDGHFGTNREEDAPIGSNFITLNYPNSGTGISSSPSFSNFSTTTAAVPTLARTFPTESHDLVHEIIDENHCDANAAGANMFTDFTSQTRTKSWAVTANPGTFTYECVAGGVQNGCATVVPMGTTFQFPFQSIVSRVLIKKSAVLVPGFLVTDLLEFEPGRTSPVTIVGFVAAAKVKIDLDTVKQGVSFHSVMSPTGVQIARNMHWLGGRSIDCNLNAFNADGNTPVWQIFPDFNSRASLATCSASFLLSNQVMRWSSIMPACGVSSTDNVTPICTGYIRYKTVTPISIKLEGI